MIKNKRKNIIIIVLMSVIICILLILYMFFPFNITNNKQNNLNDNDRNNKTKDVIQKDKSNILSENEALTILKEKVDFTEKYFTDSQLPCGENAEIDDSIPQKDGMYPYYVSKTYSSFDELNNYLLQYMSQDIININKLYNKDNYIEQNGKLYCLMLQRGNIGSYRKEKTDYKIEEITQNSIDANIISYVEDDQLPEYNVKRSINVTLTKNNNNWQITKYDGDNISYYR